TFVDDAFPNASFPALSTSLQFAPGGLSAVSSNQSASVALSRDASYPCCGTIQLSIPSLNLNAKFGTSDITAIDTWFGTWGLSYVVLGNWEEPSKGPPLFFWQQPTLVAYAGLLRNFTEYVFGFETPAASVPATGQ